MELGVCTFGDLGTDADGKGGVAPVERMRQLIEEMTLADKVGLDVFALGEHHRPDMVVSNPAVVLAAGAALTKRIRLTSAVTVLSSDDPVRVYQQFAELDLLSGGRAEIMAGRGSFIESFPLFGYDLEDYHELFEEKLDLLLKVREGEKVTWVGRHRSPIQARGVYPRSVQEPLPVWVGVGGSPDSAVRAGRLGLPMAIAIIGGMPKFFAQFVDIYRTAALADGHEGLPIAINSHGFVASTGDQAAKDYWPAYSTMMNRIGRERGWKPHRWDDFQESRGPEGFLMVGSPEEVAEKILYEYDLFGHQRFLMQISVGNMPHDKVLSAIELLGSKVAPLVRRGLAERTAA